VITVLQKERRIDNILYVRKRTGMSTSSEKEYNKTQEYSSIINFTISANITKVIS
jgi:hypothetical protein